ncbi:electron transport protein SCO1/SenC [Acetobacter pasteurianus NBRC 3299]|nr:electron transport protein SCO1/SenC [Acetobacter pasteurianus NBRC 3299]
MHRQNWKTILPVMGIIFALLIGATGLRTVLTSQSHTQIGGPYALTDENGHMVSQSDFQARYTLIYFGYTHCVDICPLTLATVSAALDELGPQGQNITPIFISVDPARDTPAVVREYIQRFSPRIVGLTGTEAQLQPIMAAFHVSARRRVSNGPGYLMDHSSLLYLMDGQNHLAGMIPVDSSAHQIAVELKQLLPSPKNHPL